MKIKLFAGAHHNVEFEVNKWLTENDDKIVIDRIAHDCMATGSTFQASVMIQYYEKR